MRVSNFLAVVFVLLFSSSVLAGTPVPAQPKDINKATLTELTKVPGIGKKTAKRILQARGAAGFGSMHEVKKIKGIGKKTFAKLTCFFAVPAEGPLPCKKPAVKGVSGGKININTANAKELAKIPSIGKKKARQIIDRRTEKGWFKTPYELQEIKGIGKKTVEKFLALVVTQVDINSARGAEFEVLGFPNGDAIVAHRKKIGGFKAVNGLQKAPGVTQATFDKAAEILVAKNAPKAPAPKAPAPKAEEPKKEEPKAEEPKKEEPKAEEPKKEEPKAEELKAEEPKAEEPKAEEPKAEEPKAEEPAAKK